MCPRLSWAPRLEIASNLKRHFGHLMQCWGARHVRFNVLSNGLSSSDFIPSFRRSGGRKEGLQKYLIDVISFPVLAAGESLKLTKRAIEVQCRLGSGLFVVWEVGCKESTGSIVLIIMISCEGFSVRIKFIKSEEVWKTLKIKFAFEACTKKSGNALINFKSSRLSHLICVYWHSTLVTAPRHQMYSRIDTWDGTNVVSGTPQTMRVSIQ